MNDRRSPTAAAIAAFIRQQSHARRLGRPIHTMPSARAGPPMR